MQQIKITNEIAVKCLDNIVIKTTATGAEIFNAKHSIDFLKGKAVKCDEQEVLINELQNKIKDLESVK